MPDPGFENRRGALTTDKDGIAERAAGFSTDGWKVEVGGLVEHPRVLGMDDIAKIAPTEERLTLLEAAEAAGVDLPFECRSGVRGQCKVRLVEGEVKMATEDALSRSWKASCSPARPGPSPTSSSMRDR